MVCEMVKRLIQEALNQRARHYQAIFSLSIFFEGDQTGAAEDSKVFLDMVRCFGAEGKALRILVSSPRPGWDVFDRVAALIKQGLQLDPENGRVLLILHYVGHGVIGDNGLVFAADSQYPRTFNYRTINQNWRRIASMMQVWKYWIVFVSFGLCDPGWQSPDPMC